MLCAGCGWSQASYSSYAFCCVMFCFWIIYQCLAGLLRQHSCYHTIASVGTITNTGACITQIRQKWKYNHKKHVLVELISVSKRGPIFKRILFVILSTPICSCFFLYTCYVCISKILRTTKQRQRWSMVRNSQIHKLGIVRTFWLLSEIFTKCRECVVLLANDNHRYVSKQYVYIGCPSNDPF